MPANKLMSSKATTHKQRNSSHQKETSSKSCAAGKASQSAKAADCEVTMDRRTHPDRRLEDSVEKGGDERRAKVQRRRQIDPTTCERDYSVQEVEFMNAMDQYKRTSGRMFPTCSEVLEVIRGLGYTQLTPIELATIRPE
ncbi:MAG: hypothetical protein MK171_02225 [Pirellulales bacterium]|nr:hypothetical protein [Pirellulales bacterium]